MKKLVVALALVGGVTAVAFGSLNYRKPSNQSVEKKMEKKQKRCNHICPFR